jgi:hypothetical protein
MLFSRSPRAIQVLTAHLVIQRATIQMQILIVIHVIKATIIIQLIRTISQWVSQQHVPHVILQAPDGNRQAILSMTANISPFIQAITGGHGTRALNVIPIQIIIPSLIALGVILMLTEMKIILMLNVTIAIREEPQKINKL